ncbi:unnamed protein product [Diamesa hyperborea]
MSTLNCFRSDMPMSLGDAIFYTVHMPLMSLKWFHHSPSTMKLLMDHTSLHSMGYHENIPFTIPKQCAKCNVGGQPLEVGNDGSVKTPQTQAYIVLVVDKKIDTQMGELVQPVINELRRELKARDVNDVNVAVIGYSKSDQYIYQFTTKRLLNFMGDLNKVCIKEP